MRPVAVVAVAAPAAAVMPDDGGREVDWRRARSLRASVSLTDAADSCAGAVLFVLAVEERTLFRESASGRLVRLMAQSAIVGAAW